MRNRVKRQVREWFRREQKRLRPDLDLLVISQPAAAGLKGAELTGSLEEAACALGAFTDRPGGS